MIRHAVIPCWLSLAGLAAAAAATEMEAPDLLRFSNGDQLHGTFLGIKDGPQASWRRTDLAAPVDFKTTLIRHIVLHGGRPLKPLGLLSHLGLVNGDRIPGTITGIDADQITLDTTYAGLLKIPRQQVAMMAPNPLGGRVYYHGPFVEDEWKMAHPAFPNGLPAAVPVPEAKDVKHARTNEEDGDGGIAGDAGDAGDGVDDKVAGEPPGRWVFSGSAWYWKNKRGGTALIRETGMPDRAVLRFNLAWKNRLCLALAFHADFVRPKPKEGEDRKGRKVRGGFISGDAADLPRLFGNSYVLQLYSNYLMLFRTSVSEDGKPAIEQIQLHNNNNLRLMETGEEQIELRSNRLTGAISLFIDDEFIAQWSESNGPAGQGAANFAGKGAGFGFMVQGDDSPVRISDIVVSEWNGMPDSARSLQVDDQDVVLMANGTDRYAGRVRNLDAQGKVIFEGKHGQFHFPLDEVAEIRFARERLASVADEPADKLVVRFCPVGSISGRPQAGDGARLSILSPSAGALQLSLDSAVMLDFNCSKQIIDNWDVDF